MPKRGFFAFLLYQFYEKVNRLEVNEWTFLILIKKAIKI